MKSHVEDYKENIETPILSTQELTKKLFDAIESINFDNLRDCFNQLADVNSVFESNGKIYRPISLATKSYLISSGEDQVEAKRILDYILQKNPDISFKDEHENSFLHQTLGIIVKHNIPYDDTIKSLLAYATTHENTVYEKNSLGNTPMHLAMSSNDSNLVKLVMSKDVNPNAKNKAGESPLAYGIKIKPNLSPEFVFDMLKGGFRIVTKENIHSIVEAKGSQRLAELLRAFEKIPMGHEEKENVVRVTDDVLNQILQCSPEELTNLIKAGLNVKLVSSGGISFISALVIAKRGDLLEVAFKEGQASLEDLEYNDNHPLARIARSGNKELADDFLKAAKPGEIRAALQQNTAELSSPFYMALEQGNLDIAVIFLLHGADPSLGRGSTQFTEEEIDVILFKFFKTAVHKNHPNLSISQENYDAETKEIAAAELKDYEKLKELVFVNPKILSDAKEAFELAGKKISLMENLHLGYFNKVAKKASKKSYEGDVKDTINIFPEIENYIKNGYVDARIYHEIFKCYSSLNESISNFWQTNPKANNKSAENFLKDLEQEKEIYQSKADLYRVLSEAKQRIGENVVPTSLIPSKIQNLDILLDKLFYRSEKKKTSVTEDVKKTMEALLLIKYFLTYKSGELIPSQEELIEMKFPELKEGQLSKAQKLELENFKYSIIGNRLSLFIKDVFDNHNKLPKITQGFDSDKTLDLLMPYLNRVKSFEKAILALSEFSTDDLSVLASYYNAGNHINTFPHHSYRDAEGKGIDPTTLNKFQEILREYGRVEKYKAAAPKTFLDEVRSYFKSEEKKEEVSEDFHPVANKVIIDLNHILDEHEIATVLSSLQDGTSPAKHIIFDKDTNLTPEQRKSFFAGLATNKTLKTFVMQDKNIDVASAIVLANALQTNNSLISLSLNGAAIDDNICKIIAPHIRNLKHLNLGYNSIKDVGAEAIAEMLLHNTSLESLDLSFTSIGETGVTALGNAIKSRETLKTFKMNDNCLGNTAVIAFLEILRGNKSLETIELAGNNLKADILPFFKSFLQETPSLKNLNLRGNILGDNAASIITSNISSLNLSDTWIDNLFIENLIKNLPSCTGLKSLDLSNNLYITDAGIKMLAQAIEEGKINLESINLQNTGITDAAIDYLIQAAKTNPCLKILDLSKNENLTYEGIKKLLTAIENNEISLEAVNIYKKDFGEDFAEYFNGFIGNNYSLKFLGIYENPLKNKDLFKDTLLNKHTSVETEISIGSEKNNYDAETFTNLYEKLLQIQVLGNVGEEKITKNKENIIEIIQHNTESLSTKIEIFLALYELEESCKKFLSAAEESEEEIFIKHRIQTYMQQAFDEFLDSVADNIFKPETGKQYVDPDGKELEFIAKLLKSGKLTSESLRDKYATMLLMDNYLQFKGEKLQEKVKKIFDTKKSLEDQKESPDSNVQDEVKGLDDYQESNVQDEENSTKELQNFFGNMLLDNEHPEAFTELLLELCGVDTYVPE